MAEQEEAPPENEEVADEEPPKEEEAPQENEEEAPKEEAAPKEEEEEAPKEEAAPKEEVPADEELKEENKEKAEEQPKEKAEPEPEPEPEKKEETPKKKKKSKRRKKKAEESSEESLKLWKKISKKGSTEINWYLCKLDGKVGTTSNLTHVNSGSGGAAEIVEFVADKEKAMMFGLLLCITTDDSKSVRAKFIYLRFVGSKVKSISKAKLTPSLGKIDDQFPCKHLTLDINEKCAEDMAPKKMAIELLRVGGAHKPDKMEFGPNQEVLMKDI